MKSANQITEDLLTAFDGVKEKKVDVVQALALSNLAGRVTAIACAQLRYAAQTKQTVRIDFFQGDVKNDPV